MSETVSYETYAEMDARRIKADADCSVLREALEKISDGFNPDDNFDDMKLCASEMRECASEALAKTDRIGDEKGEK